MTKQNEKDAKRVPELRFKGFTDDWEQRKLGDIGETFSGLSGKNKNDFGHGDASFITYMNVFSNSIADLRGTEHVEIDSKQNQVMYGDILFTTSSETPEEVGMSSVWLGQIKNTYLNSFCFGYRILEKQNFDSYYMAYLLRAENFRKRMTVLAQGISRYNISKKQVMNTFVNFPTMKEQRKIGKTLFLIDRTITLHEEQHRQLERLKKALLQKMFADETGYPALRFKGFTEKWEQSYLKDIASVNSGRDYKHLNKGNIPVYGTGGYMLSVDKALSNTKDGIGIGRKGTINNPYILKAPFWTVDTLFYVIPYNVDLNFLYGIFQKIDWRKKDESTGVPSLSKENINKTKFKIPAISEQKEIGTIFQNLDTLITLHQHKIDNLKRLKRALLQKMFV
ncbi:restriction endonuclease subunit S [Limosilactobacillus mucosae]|uniref:restriction endonuclease subunit S n=1 Tax=Limosilactobacillus mucosae TaxID=97478 RepID=UPI0022E1BAF2|nr:restriction endonuclease subunit S [Limosilactobacillus mucosae]